jgi:hypothetical protein
MSLSQRLLRRRRTPQGQKGLYRFAHGLRKTSRTQILNHLIRCNGYRDYLEIGVHANDNFARIAAASKCGVDPAPRGAIAHVQKTTSDAFFARLGSDPQFDLIFVDGLHEEKQVLRDVESALQHLRDGGSIAVHDCNPPTEWHQREVRDDDSLAWNGTVWKAWARLRCERADLRMHVVDTDWGVGILQRGRQEPHRLPEGIVLDYDYLDRHREALLALISVERFLELY